MIIEIVDFTINSMVIFNSYVKLPEGNYANYECGKKLWSLRSILQAGPKPNKAIVTLPSFKAIVRSMILVPQVTGSWRQATVGSTCIRRFQAMCAETYRSIIKKTKKNDKLQKKTLNICLLSILAAGTIDLYALRSKLRSCAPSYWKLFSKDLWS